MPKKIKIVLILVAVVAVFSVYELAQYIHSVANGNSAYQESSPLPSPSDDSDNDGLNDQQEVIWGTDPFNADSDGDGFKDGEEVKSGHNPLVPGPNDLISADNLTQQLSELAVDGLAEGSLQSDSPNYEKSLADITSAVADSAKYIFNKEINDSELPIINSSTQANETYLESITPYAQLFGQLLNNQYAHIEENLNAIGQNGFSDSKVKSFFSDQATQYQDILDKVSSISVPKNLKPSISQFLSLVLQMRDICNAVARGNDDPIKASFALDALGGMFDKYTELINEFGNVLLPK